MKSPPFSASRVALVAAAMISSTLCDSASRLNLASVCRAEVTAVGVRLRPSSPPAPSRTMSFSLSTTSNDTGPCTSACTRTSGTCELTATSTEQGSVSFERVG